MKTKTIALILALTATAALADTKVSDRVSLSSGDLAPATDILPIVDISAGTAGSKKITINDLFTGWGVSADGKSLVTAANYSAMRTALGLDGWYVKTVPSGTVVGTTDTQTLTNKTLGAVTAFSFGSDATGDIYYRNSGGILARLGVGSNGQVLTLASGLPSWAGATGLANFSDTLASSAPNNTVTVSTLSASGSASNMGIAIIPKGTGFITRRIPSGSSSTGNQPGSGAVDLQAITNLGSRVASGTQASILGGESNTASGNYSLVGSGRANVASGLESGVASGNANQATAANAFVGGGLGNEAPQVASAVLGGQYALTRAGGAHARANGRFGATGDAQAEAFVLRRETTNATQTELSATGAGPSTGDRIVLPNNSAMGFKGRIVARSSTGDAAVFVIEGGIKRGANAAATALVGTPTVTQPFADSGAATWVVSVDADTTNGSLRIQVTGAASTTIRWVADIQTVEAGG